MGRPVVYSSFSQCTARQNNIDDVIEHVSYLIENATKVMKVGVMQWVFVIDCAGMSSIFIVPEFSGYFHISTIQAVFILYVDKK